MRHIAEPIRGAARVLLALCLTASFTLILAHELNSRSQAAGAELAPIWQAQSLPSRSEALLGISGVADTFSRAGWAVGESGTILRTEDGGATWHDQSSGVTETLNAVAALSAAAAWTVGDGGTILTTMDGKTWKTEDSGSEADLFGVAALDATHIWAVGAAGTILFYDGEAWTAQMSGTSQDLRSVTVAEAGRVWAAGDQGTIQFFDGSAWRAQASGTSSDLRAIAAATGADGVWACGARGTIVVTADGTTWKPQTSPTHETLNGISAVDSRTAYAAGDAGIILQTANGSAWNIQESNNRNPVQSIVAVQGDRVWTAGSGWIETTEDAGATWIIRYRSPAVSRISSVEAVDAYRAWVAGDAGSILHTEDGGVTWQQQVSGTDHYLTGIAAGTSEIAWAAGEGGVILNTADAGAHWVTQYDDGRTSFNGLWAVAARTAWAVGDGGIIKKTVDGGEFWVDQTSGTAEDLYAVCALGADTAWAAGSGGTLLFTADGGAHWTPQATGTVCSLRAVGAADAVTVWAVGDDGAIIRTTDGGLTWTGQASGVTLSLKSVSAVDTQTAWVSGEKGAVLKTTDGGEKWVKQDSTVRAELAGLQAIDGNIAWAAGEGATLLRTVDRARYFAEGHTGDGFQEYLCLFNPQDSQAAVTVQYLFTDGSKQLQPVTLAPESRTTIDVNAVAGPGRDVSVIVQMDRAVQVERPIYFNYGGAWSGGSDTWGAPGPSVNWNFAEGYTGAGFDQYVCILNPQSRPAAIMFDFQTQENGPVGLAGYIVPANSRATFRVNDLLGGAYSNSLQLKSTVPVVAERSMYFDYRGGEGGMSWSGGHTVVGAPVLVNQYLFAEGTTRSGFDEYLTLQNPGTSSIQVNAVFEPDLGKGAPLARVFTVDAGKRQTVPVRDVLGTDMDVSIKVSSAAPFLAERVIYFDYRGYGADWTGGSCVIGAHAVSTEWLFAEGATGDLWHDYICLQNPNSSDAMVQVIYYSQERGKILPDNFVIPANGRVTLVVNSHAGPDLRLAARIRVTSGPGIIAERSQYFDFGGWSGGHGVLGAIPGN